MFVASTSSSIFGSTNSPTVMIGESPRIASTYLASKDFTSHHLEAKSDSLWLLPSCYSSDVDPISSGTPCNLNHSGHSPPIPTLRASTSPPSLSPGDFVSPPWRTPSDRRTPSEGWTLILMKAKHRVANTSLSYSGQPDSAERDSSPALVEGSYSNNSWLPQNMNSAEKPSDSQ